MSNWCFFFYLMLWFLFLIFPPWLCFFFIRQWFIIRLRRGTYQQLTLLQLSVCYFVSERRRRLTKHPDSWTLCVVSCEPRLIFVGFPNAMLQSTFVPRRLMLTFLWQLAPLPLFSLCYLEIKISKCILCVTHAAHLWMYMSSIDLESDQTGWILWNLLTCENSAKLKAPTTQKHYWGSLFTLFFPSAPTSMKSAAFGLRAC